MVLERASAETAAAVLIPSAYTNFADLKLYLGTGVTVGSIDEKSYKCEKPKIKRHIFVKEKAPWTLIPEDGVVRLDTSPDAHLIVPHPPAS